MSIATPGFFRFGAALVFFLSLSSLSPFQRSISSFYSLLFLSGKSEEFRVGLDGGLAFWKAKQAGLFDVDDVPFYYLRAFMIYVRTQKSLKLMRDISLS